MANSITSATSVPTAALQWNCRGLRNKAAEFSLRLREKPIPVLALCEGCLPGTDSLPGYVKYTSPTLPTFPHGSAAVYVAQAIPQCRVDTSSLPPWDYECVAVRVKLASTTLTIASVYIQAHPRARCAGVLEGLRGQTRGALLVCGDLNAYHSAWGSASINKRGRDLASEAERAGLVVANDGSPTFLRGPVTTNAIDVTFHTPDLPVTWRTSGSTEGSDHFPIHIGLDGESRSNSRIKKVICWDDFRSALLASTGDPVDAIAKYLELATKTVRVPAGMPDPDLPMHNLLAARKRAQRRYRRSRTNEDKYALKKACTKLYRYCRRLRRSQWASFCRSLNSRTSLFRVWRVIQTLTSARHPKEPFRCLALALGRTVRETAELFADSFSSVALVTSLGVTPSPLCLDDGEPCPLDDCFTLSELEASLCQLRRKSASGPDGVSNQALRNLPETSKSWLLARLNQIWITAVIPKP